MGFVDVLVSNLYLQTRRRDRYGRTLLALLGLSQDEEIWKAWIECIHLTYLLFDFMTQWIYERFVEKYEDKSVERPEWMNKENEGKFIKRIAEIYIWKGTGGEEVDKALAELFGRNGADLEEWTGNPKKKSRKGISRSRKVEPEEARAGTAVK